MLHVEEVVLHVREHALRDGQALVERLPVGLVVDQRAVLFDEGLALLDELLGGTTHLLARLDRLDVHAYGGEGDVEVVVPGVVMVVPARTRRDVEPRIAGLLEFVQPVLAVRALLHLGHDHGRALVVENELIELGLDRQSRQADEFGVRLVHDHVDTRDHLGEGRYRDVREDRVGGVDEGDVGGVPEIQELEVILPHLQAHVDQLVVLGEELVSAADALVLEDEGLVFNLGQRFELHGLEFGEEPVHLDFPVSVEPVPVLVVVAGPLHECGNPTAHFLRIGHAHRRDVHVAVHDAVVDTERRRHEERAGVVLRERQEPRLVPDEVEGVVRLGIVKAVVEPQLALFELGAGGIVLAELVVIRVQLLPPFRTRDRRDVVRAGELLRHASPFVGHAVSMPRTGLSRERTTWVRRSARWSSGCGSSSSTRSPSAERE